jgi:hypothetical protein
MLDITLGMMMVAMMAKKWVVNSVLRLAVLMVLMTVELLGMNKVGMKVALLVRY